MGGSGRTGTCAARRARPPPKVFLGIGAGLFVLNHLSVVFGVSLQAEALVLGSWLVLMGGWVQFAGRTFDAVWAWVDPSGWRTIGFVLLSLTAALAVAEAVAWWGYGQHLSS
jgi:hypothetical protein